MNRKSSVIDVAKSFQIAIQFEWTRVNLESILLNYADLKWYLGFQERESKKGTQNLEYAKKHKTKQIKSMKET